MLVLTRKSGETILLGDNVRITVLSTEGNSVRIGISAPPSVIVHREEIYDKIVNENRRSAAASSAPQILKQFGDLKNESKTLRNDKNSA